MWVIWVPTLPVSTRVLLCVTVQVLQCVSTLVLQVVSFRVVLGVRVVGVWWFLSVTRCELICNDLFIFLIGCGL